MAELRSLIGAPPARVPQVDWTGVHARLGFRLPADYREFIDAYGPGTLGDIQIMAPDQPAETDLFTLLERAHAQARDLPMPFYPESGGSVAWGETPGGYTWAWGPAEDDPDQWIAVLITQTPEASGQAARAGRSFTSLLVD
jgi:hypothetical protein